MEDGWNEALLRTRILAHSAGAVDWKTTKEQWRPQPMETLQEPVACLCGQPITCVVRMDNVVTGHRVVIGTQCSEQFQGLNPDAMIANISSFAWISANPRDHSPREHLIDLAVGSGWITPWEESFLRNLCNYSAALLTERQLVKREEVNHKLLRYRWSWW